MSLKESTRDPPTQISSLLFDNSVNLVWAGDSSGYTRSYTLAPSGSFQQFQLCPYTKFKATVGNPIIHQLNHQRGIISLSNNSISLNNRRGICQLAVTSESVGAPLKNLSCITLNSNTSNELYIGGSNQLSKVNLLKPQELTHFNHDGNLSFINNLLKYLTLGKSNGSIEVFDPNENKVVKTFYGHNGLLSDLDVLGTYVATCGYSVRPRRNGNAKANDFMVDPLVNIYDLRMMRPLPPIPFPAGASFVRFHPKLPNIIIIASTTGQLQFVDIYDQLNVHLYQANLNQIPQLATASLSAVTPSYLSNLDISENGEYLTFTDGFSNLHLWSNVNNTNKNFINFPGSLEQPDIVIQPPSINPVDVDDYKFPLSSIGMPYYKDFLLSNYRTDLVFEKELLKLPQKIDPTLMEISDNYSLLQLNQRNPQASSLQSKFIAYDKSKYGRRNLYDKYESLKNSKLTNGGKKTTNPSLLPKFLSEQDSKALTRTMSNSSETNELNHNLNNSTVDDPSESIFQYKILDNKSNKVPNCYSRLQIQYSKFGVQDFDFRFYNKSLSYCGLENHVDNSYINSLLQLYRFSPIFYNLITNNLLQEWLPNDSNTVINEKNPQGSSVLNELAYLFDMMYKSNENPVKISNFSQVLNQIQYVKHEKLYNFDELKSVDGFDLQNLIIKFNKFLVDCINVNQANQFSSVVTDYDKIINYFNIVSELEIISNGCEFYDKKIVNQLTLDLVSPPQNVLNRMVNNSNSFNMNKKNHNLITFLEYSLNQSKILPCNSNNNHQLSFPHTVEIRQTLLLLPPILSINIPFNNQEYLLIKGFKKWLVPEFYTIKNSLSNKLTFKPMITQFNQEATKYELLGYVCEINHDLDSIKGEHNLISYIKIKSNDKYQWFLFNDFLVMPMPEDEVFNISYAWKKPVVLLYHNVQHPLNDHFNYFNESFLKASHKLNDSILYRDHFAGDIRESYKKEYTLLTQDEAPQPGTLVAIDAEFVTLQPEELEISYDGTKNLIKPKNLSLARISVIRGEGDKEGVPFIDDYILHTEPIFDYLTSFSGIEPGDLDPINSSKNLVTLQTAYRRLWLLLNLGCVFVGHGLKNDFRCINLNVPQRQIRDTIDYFYLPDLKRKLSLKFLAFILLKENVQTGNHDSIEDAYTALLLYKRYVELQRTGELDSTLKRIYKEGQQLRFRVPWVCILMYSTILIVRSYITPVHHCKTPYTWTVHHRKPVHCVRRLGSFLSKTNWI